MGQPNYYGIIPSRVRYDKTLCANAKLLYAEITALTQSTGICWAGNEYFSELYGVDVRTISRWVRELKDSGHILTSLTYIEGSKEVEKRMIWLVDASILPSQTEVVTKLSGGYRQNCQGGGDKNVRDNTTSINTTSYNTIGEKTVCKKTKFIPPTIEEIESFAKEKGYKLDCNKILNHYDYERTGTWTNSKGKQVRNWKQTVENNWFRDEYKIKQSNALSPDEIKRLRDEQHRKYLEDNV